MFPEEFVEQQLLSYTSPGDQVFDPFCGRGTTVFESLLRGRPASGSDVSPVAACVASAKAAAPEYQQIVDRLKALEDVYRSSDRDAEPPSPFFSACYEEETLCEVLFLREELQWRTDSIDCFIAAMTLGALHGESHRSDLYLSNRMPRTISTKPDYSIRWWEKRGLTPPRRATFDVLRKLAAFRYRMPPARLRGEVRQTDARTSGTAFPELKAKVQLVVTSPPYLDTTDYAEDQWLRLWFLGGESRPKLRKNRDDRHTQVESYWSFLQESWSGMRPLLAEAATIVIRIGGAKLSKEELRAGLDRTLTAALGQHDVRPLHEGVTSSIRPRETSAFRPAPPRANVEHDFVYELRVQ